VRFACLLVIFLQGCTGTSSRPSLASLEAASRAKAHTDLAANYYTRGQYGVALDEVNEAIAADPTYVPAYNVMGIVYMDLKEDDKAGTAFQRALRIAPADAEANNNYGWFLCTRGKVGESINFFSTALRDSLYATPQVALLNAGICSRKKGDDAAAEDFFRKVTKIQINHTQANLQLADINYRRGQYETAREYMARVMEWREPSAEALWLGVRIEHKLKDRAAEAAYAMKLKRRYPDSPETRLLQNGQYQ
jgi:type IV pilus assembly protein PilF